MAASVPEVVPEPSLAQVLEIITRAVFQAGVKWSQIAGHWDAYRVAFANFDPEQVANFDSIDAERILAQDGVLRVPRKVQATIANARALLGAQREFGSFHGYVASFPTYAALATDMKKRFAHLGDMNVWYVLFRCGEAVPRFEPWVKTIKGEHPRMREMVDLARSQGRSPEI
ncbi:MAG TPA: DNA-3-methyladenine glycosylase I [Alphaproteobacteria bacterium]|nr:DNA-3-methyladenine glycosylase I [Alphaproteobacteria bacterium]